MAQLLHRIEGVAAQLDVGRTTVYEIVKRGELQTVHIGRRALVTDDSLRAYVARLAADAGTATQMGGDAA
jgi:excisionase family DNA binding protein